MPDSTCRWAILGTADIARKNWRAIALAGNARLVAVASRSAERAKAFIDSCQAHVPVDPRPVAVGSYQEALERDDVDAVYLPLPTGIRAEWAIRAADHGKHVLVEKPCGTSVEEVERIVAACRRAKVQFMDGVMFLHGARLEPVRQCLGRSWADGGIGTVRRIATQFSFKAPPEFFSGNIRVRHDLEPLGCLGDLGWYTIAFVLWAMHPRLPDAVTGRLVEAVPAEGGGPPVPVEFAGELIFSKAPTVTAAFFCSFLVEHQQWVHVSGTEGSLRMEDFVLPFRDSQTSFTVALPTFETDGCDFRMERHERQVVVPEHGNGHPTAQEAKLFRDFSNLVLGGTPDDRWPNGSLATQRVMMDCLAAAQTSEPLPKS
jgi:predicted dehydrogenase